jgi:hypothetical protein
MKLLISIAANVYNHQDIHDYIKTLHTGQANIDRWLDKTLRVYLLNESKYHVTVSKPPKNAPEWALKAKDLVQFKPSSSLTQDLEHATMWLATFPETKTLNVSVAEAIKQGELHIERENKKASDKEGVIETLHTFKDGWTIVSLKDEQALKREGKIMQHCVGKYHKNVGNGKKQIWSLRDPNNQPHCTMEYLIKEKVIAQIKGKQNKGVVQKYQQYVIQWLNLVIKQNLIKTLYEGDMENINIKVKNGVWYNMLQLPEGFECDTLTYNDTVDPIIFPNRLKVQKLSFNGAQTDIVIPEDISTDLIRIENCSGAIHLPPKLTTSVLEIYNSTGSVYLPNQLTVQSSFKCINTKAPLVIEKYPERIMQAPNQTLSLTTSDSKLVDIVTREGSGVSFRRLKLTGDSINSDTPLKATESIELTFRESYPTPLKCDAPIIEIISESKTPDAINLTLYLKANVAKVFSRESAALGKGPLIFKGVIDARKVHCVGLSGPTLPQLKNVKALYLDYCTQLKELPNFKLSALCIENCKQLAKLPEGLEVTDVISVGKLSVPSTVTAESVTVGDFLSYWVGYK